MTAFRSLKLQSIFLFFLTLFQVEGFSSTLDSESRAYALKAVFLFHCAHFTEWPSSSFANSNDPIVIGILGEDPFRRALDEAVENEVVNGRSIIVRRFSSLDEVRKCHILFICNSEAAHMDQIIESLKNKKILTVADSDQFASRGGMIQFGIENNKLQVKINLRASKAEGLTISSKLLRLSKIIDQPKEGE
jgi:hypothetical protein